MVDPAIAVDRGTLARQPGHRTDQGEAVPDTDEKVGHLLPVFTHDQRSNQQRKEAGGEQLIGENQ
ncbi:hypothetical protein D3C79_981300 [compost metagenome]